ncbi:hypothetical protein [Dickeya dianthicola]|uniref:hypothetical protein n=1 Tax=Dickeya dianthicola TaxID=204039 RepID=UPI003019F10C
MPDYRKKLNLLTSNGQRVFILQCNKSEKKSVIKRYHNNGGFSWLSDHVAVKHPDGKPKILHIPIPDEGIYQIYGQPELSGLYCVYSSIQGQLYYTKISEDEKIILINENNNGISFRNTLLLMNKKPLY